MMDPKLTRRLVVGGIVGAIVLMAFFVGANREWIADMRLFMFLTAGAYVGIYNGGMFVWEHWGWPRVHPHAYIGGYWEMVNTYPDHSCTVGIFRIRQVAERAELVDGYNTEFRPDDKYICEWHSTSANLQINSQAHGGKTVFEYGYKKMKWRKPGEDPEATRANETLIADSSTGDGGVPDRLIGGFQSHPGRVPQGINRCDGTSINRRITKEKYNKLKQKHIQLREQILGTTAGGENISSKSKAAATESGAPKPEKA